MRGRLFYLLHFAATSLGDGLDTRNDERAPSMISDRAFRTAADISCPGFGNSTIRYREVPSGICETEQSVKSYAGYVDIDEHTHMFFWLFEARNTDPTTAPLTTWISGGPGDSSMSELFTEHGPCRVEPDGKTLHYNPFSWNNYSNVLYIDQPVQVGFSYTELVPAYIDSDDEEIFQLKKGQACPDDAFSCGNFSKPDPSTTANSTEAAAPNFWLTLQAVMSAFPQYSEHGFHLGSESYGGHYVPVFSRYIQNKNSANIPGARHIDLQSILVGNGWFSPQIQLESYFRFGFDPGSTYGLHNLDDAVKNKVHDAYYGEGNCLDRLKDCDTSSLDQVCQTADWWCDAHVQQAWTNHTHRDNNDIREMDPSPFPNEFYVDYLNMEHVREAIGALQTYVEFNPTVGIAFDSTGDDARELGIIQILSELVESGVHVTLYAGDADYECNWLGIEAVAAAVKAKGYDQAGYTDIITPDGVTRGQVKQSGPFSFVRVYQAGHAVGAFQPLLQQTIFARTIAGMDLATGKVAAAPHYRSNGSEKSTYVEGRATVFDKVESPQSTYNYTSNQPTLEDFQPVWNGPVQSA